jgi:hypothetical protein
MEPGQIQHFMEHPVKDHVVLKWLTAEIIKYKECAVEVKEIRSSSMDQHWFLYANTCEDIFIKWSEYDKIHPLH